MAVSARKADALPLYCLARQAERSIDFGLHSQSMWQEMREYYEGARRARAESAASRLRTMLPDGRIASMKREDFPDRPVYLLPLYVGRIAVNQFRTRWRFSIAEVAFLAQTFASLVAVLQLPEKPPTNDLVNLRLELAACQWIIGERLMGIPALRTVQRIEHFGQSAHVASIKWEDIFPDSPDATNSNGSVPGELRKSA